MFKVINKSQLKFEFEQRSVIKVLRKLVYKEGVNKCARQIREEALNILSPHYPNLHLSLSKVKRLLRKYVGVSYKRTVKVNAAKMTVFSIDLRERWIRLYLKLTS